MATSDTAKAATALCNERPSNIQLLGGGLENSHTPSIVVAQLVGSGIAIADNIKAHGSLHLCRQLLDAGIDPDAELLCYRNGQLALRISSIGYGAKIVVRETATEGPRFATWRPFPAARSRRPFGKTAMPSNVPVQA
jgi:hypothetical protein